MRKIYFFVFCAFFIVNSAFSQSGTWTWVSGPEGANQAAVYGTQGVPSVNNHPTGVYEACEWKDKQGNFWIYGGTYPNLSILWRFNPVTLEWTWMKGDTNLYNQAPIYGLQGIPDYANTPGARSFCTTTWVDTAGGLWLFGGINEYNFNYDNKSDLWKYDISINQWTWVSGPQSSNSAGVHGTQGIPGAYNVPGPRTECASAWTDAKNNLWLFGGWGYDEVDSFGLLNDMMKYDINTNRWTWMKGSAFVDTSPNWGTRGVPSPANDPGGRFTYTKWKDNQGNFWIMGGGGGSAGLFGPTDLYNDVWKYDLSLNEWIWMWGSGVANDTGNYHAHCDFDTINQPSARFENRSSATDNTGRFWMFGGTPGIGAPSDLWVFDPQQLKWNWVNGTNAVGLLPGNYGTLNVPSPSNMPPSRFGANAWWGNDNKFYMFGGQNNNFITILDYSDVWVYDPDTNCVPAVDILPVANFQASDTTLCANDCINFTDMSTNATSWQWLFSGAIDSTSNAENPQNICYLSAGTYNVTLVASNSGGSDSVTFSNYIKVNVAPPTPGITQHEDTLYCSTDPSYTSYQWTFDSTLIAGATDTFLVVSKSGNYNIQVSNASGCKIAVGINIVLGLQNYTSDNSISLFPNPATSQLTIHSSSFHSEAVTVSVMNVLGQIIQEEKIKWSNDMIINVKPLQAGIYFLHLKTENGGAVKNFVKQ